MFTMLIYIVMEIMEAAQGKSLRETMMDINAG